MVTVFLPAYNEAVALPRLVKKFAEAMDGAGEPYRIVVLDDGSSDRTAQVARELAERYPIDVICHERNKGLGQTMRDGMEYLARVTGDGDWIVTLDCDDTHEPQYLPAALAKARLGHDVVILSRFAKGGGQEGLSAWKTFLSMGAGVFLKILFPIKGVREYSCNYRVYRAGMVKRAVQVFGPDFIRLTHWGFVATPEILIKMRMLGARITESPFVLKYDQKPTPSTNKALRTILGYFALAWHCWGRKA
ncbi:MAG: glycosyltransferase family 2 protein [Candidatus Omnitrophica bacterium]|nr:glycosyltransferase family 2 protein [Candidatus Omnitrophota bacterium]